MKPMETPVTAKAHNLPVRKTRKPTQTEPRFSEESATRINGKQPALADAVPEVMNVRLTTVAANINVGLGNALFIRGEGEGLSWDKGVALHCIGDSTWTWASTAIKDKAVFKLLLNDVVWARGDNLVVEAGKDLRLAPAF
jgi:hypothetical protein